MFTHVMIAQCRDLEDRTGTYSRSTNVSLMLLCCRRVRIRYGMLTGWNVESACNGMKGMRKGGLSIVGIGVANQWPCCNKMCMLRAEVVEERGYVLSRMFSECNKEKTGGCNR